MVSVKTMPLAALILLTHLLMLWNRSKMIQHIPSHRSSRLYFNQSRMSYVVHTVVIMSLVSDIRLLFSTTMVFYPSLAAIWQQVCTTTSCRIFCKIWEDIPMFKYTVLDRFVPNCRDLQPHNLPNNPPINQHNRYVTLPFVMYLSVFADSFRYSLNISNALLMNRISLLSLFISIITHVTANSPTFPPT